MMRDRGGHVCMAVGRVILSRNPQMNICESNKDALLIQYGLCFFCAVLRQCFAWYHGNVICQ